MVKQGGKGKKSAGKAATSGPKFSKRSVVKTDIYDEGESELTGKQKQRANASDKYSKQAMESMDFDQDDGKVMYGDDESIDSESDGIGWNSDDDAAYGGMLGGSKKKGEDSGSEEDYDEEGGEGTTLLSDMLSGFASSSSQKHTAQPSELDDLFNNAASEDGSDAGEYSEDDSEDGHEGLLSAIDKFTKTPDGSKDRQFVSKQAQFAPENQFSSTDPSKVSISTLLGALSSDSRGLSAVKTKLADLEKSSIAPKAVDKVITERVERSVAYSASKADMNKWQSTVVANRNASTLDLAGDKRQLPSYKGLIEKFEATNDLERDIDMVLVESSGYEGNALQLEEEALHARHATPEQMKENLAELAKIRALMFYEQMKRHRVNKIKSKAYHRIRNRKNKRDRGGDDAEDSDALSDPEAVEEAEKAAATRVKERMNLKHQNTTKWARMAMQYGKGNKDLRMAYHESVQLGHDLAKKVDATGGSDDDNEGYKSSDDEGDAKGKLKRQLRGIIDGEETFDDSNDAEANSKYKKLFDMDFMRNAKTRQQDKAREEATTLLREIQEMEQSDYDSDNSVPKLSAPKQSVAEKKLADKERQAAAKQQMEALFSSNKNSATASKAGPKSAAAVEAEEISNNPWLSGINQIDRALDGKAGKVAKKKNAKSNATGIKVSVPMHGEDVAPVGKNNSNANKGPDSAAPKEKTVMVTMAGKKVKAYAVPPKPVVEPTPAVKAPVMNKNEPKKQILLQKSQEDLVKEAFAGPDYESEFQAGKQAAVDAELDIDTKKQKIMTAVKPGWGDWAGTGLVGVSEKSLRNRKRQLDTLDEENAQKRVARKDGQVMNVMISDRRVKSSSKYKIAAVPHPFTSREEYERSIQMPLGEEWNASHIVRKNTKPDIMVRAGRVVAPIKLSKEASAAKKAKISSNRRGL